MILGQQNDRRHLATLALMALNGGAMPLHAQIGRFKVFAPIAGAVGRCRSTPVQSVVPGESANRTVSLELDGEPERLLIASTNARGGIVRFTTFVSVRAGGTSVATRREGERVLARFDANGQFRSGERTYFTTGTPATRAEDRGQPLSPDEAAAALLLARKVMERCAR